jgi:hypothetical protein
MRPACHENPLPNTHLMPALRPGTDTVASTLPCLRNPMATVTGWHEPVRIGVSPADTQGRSEKSIGLSAAINPATFSPTEFSPRLRDAKTLNSFAKGRLAAESPLNVQFCTNRVVTPAWKIQRMPRPPIHISGQLVTPLRRPWKSVGRGGWGLIEIRIL